MENTGTYILERKSKLNVFHKSLYISHKESLDVPVSIILSRNHKKIFSGIIIPLKLFVTNIISNALQMGLNSETDVNFGGETVEMCIKMNQLKFLLR